MAIREYYYNYSYDTIRKEAINFYKNYLTFKDGNDEQKEIAAKCLDSFEGLVEVAMDVHGKTARIITMWQKEARKKIAE